MEPFSSSRGYEYILLVVEYVPKWVEAISTKLNDHRVVIQFFQNYIFAWFGCLKVIISDGGTYFTNH